MRISKSRKRRLAVLGTLSIVAFIFFCVNVFNYTYKIISLTKREKELAQVLDELKTEKEHLDNEIEKLQDEEYIARYAREKYLYTKNGEYVIKIIDGEVVDTEVSEEMEKLGKTKILIVISSLVGLAGLTMFARIKKS